MPNVINLATEEKQDQILANFPIIGGTNFSDYIFNFTAPVSASNTAPLVTMLEINGSGFISAIDVEMSNIGDNKVIITADGNSKILNVGNGETKIFPVLIPFNNSVKIELERTVSNAGIRAKAFYLLG